MQPCRARRSQSLLLGVELERQRRIAQRLPSTVGLGCWKSWWGEESRARSSSVRLPWQHRWSSSAVLSASARPAAQRYRPIPAGLRVACCLNLLIRVGGNFTGKSELFNNSVCGRAVGGDLLRSLGSAARCGEAAGALLVMQALLRRGSP